MRRIPLFTPRTSLRGLGLCLLAIGGCNKSAEEPSAAIEAQPAALQQAAPAPASPAAPEPAPTPPQAPQQSQVIKRRGPDPGFSLLSLKDELPICLFSDLEAREKAPYLKDVKPQKLSANSPITFGVYGPGCLNEACDDRPTLQCWVELPGDNTIVVHSRFSSFHKEGSECTEDCMDLDTACWSLAPLKAGTYTVKHGDKTYKVKLPSNVKDPCFGAK